ncbi:glycoside hydrolase family 75 protein [Streptomyces sp. MBT67]|uniref:glycoside hydrolase family 75 protein n=1 Tax=unclassified Streptomyces TaxID=2593676 RepID=UPI00190C07F4|nr:MULTISPECIES: glycoside hydrolase family 75 protein [unclassified Streptomyces]MBK3531948.1 glycoside hydrolase family 75 protein [Streptomyces sp. MBT72]MBK3539204.1 glycoside hydrolase family 75 protein [Streptomyces sp. MBT67]MBK3553483.1 glycoside hydrolase family 75 protein [Streptomyces sp. MBT61]MBK6030214.1 glycoside hydrolase family 75 protein [Streptomyces sp. MBT59]
MRTRMLALTSAACGAALLGAAALPASASGSSSGSASGSAQEPEAEAGVVTAAELLAEVRACSRISKGRYRTDSGSAKATVPVCGTRDAVFWKADMDIDCDGRKTRACNRKTDPYFLPETAFQSSRGEPLDSAALPHVVVPGPSKVWDYRKAGLTGGSVVAVVYRDWVRYGVIGDTGPTGIIGEASYAMAKTLGIDPDPSTGGAESGVTYIAFKNSRISPIESRARAQSRGAALAREFVGR